MLEARAAGGVGGAHALTRGMRDSCAPLETDEFYRSSACAQVIVVMPESFLKMRSHGSDSRSWCVRSHVSNAASVRKERIRVASG